MHIVDQLRWESAMFAFFEPLISVNVSSLLEANYNLGNDRVGECSSANIKWCLLETGYNKGCGNVGITVL